MERRPYGTTGSELSIVGLGGVVLVGMTQGQADAIVSEAIDRGVTLLNACVSIGIGLGAFVAGKLSGDQVELGLVPIGSIGLGLFAMDLCLATNSVTHALAGHFLLGLSGGLFIVPLESFLQQSAGEHTKGRVIAVLWVSRATVISPAPPTNHPRMKKSR